MKLCHKTSCLPLERFVFCLSRSTEPLPLKQSHSFLSSSQLFPLWRNCFPSNTQPVSPLTLNRSTLTKHRLKHSIIFSPTSKQRVIVSSSTLNDSSYLQHSIVSSLNTPSFQSLTDTQRSLNAHSFPLQRAIVSVSNTQSFPL